MYAAPGSPAAAVALNGRQSCSPVCDVTSVRYVLGLSWYIYLVASTGSIFAVTLLPSTSNADSNVVAAHTWTSFSAFVVIAYVALSLQAVIAYNKHWLGQGNNTSTFISFIAFASAKAALLLALIIESGVSLQYATLALAIPQFLFYILGLVLWRVIGGSWIQASPTSSSSSQQFAHPLLSNQQSEQNQLTAIPTNPVPAHINCSMVSGYFSSLLLLACTIAAPILIICSFALGPSQGPAQCPSYDPRTNYCQGWIPTTNYPRTHARVAGIVLSFFSLVAHSVSIVLLA